MNKIYYLLLLALLLPLAGNAQSCVSVMQGRTTYSTKDITFSVKWNTCNGANHLYKVWVLVDYCEVDAAGNAVGQWQRATVGTPTVTGGPAYTAGNTTGFWLTAAGNGYTANVKVRIGTGSATRFKWCAVALDYPPHATFTSPTIVKFGGTAPFVLSNGASVSAAQKNGYAPATAFSSFTDKTNAPGTINCGSAVATPALTGGGSVCATATLSVNNSQVGVKYQLYNGTTAGESKNGTGGAISFTPVGAGNYKVVGKNNYYAACAATSTVQTVTLYPTVTQSNPSVATICYNATNTFSLAAATGGAGTYTYLWQQSGNNSTWTNATGTRTNAAYTTPALTSNMYYRRVVTSCGNSATSTAALVTVRANVTQSNPSVATICYNATNTFSLAAATGGAGTYTYLWQQSGNNSTWTNATGTRTNAAYTTPALTANMYYRRVVTSCGNSATSTAALVTLRTDGTRDYKPGVCGCSSALNLTLVGSYCRNLSADGACAYQDYEVKCVGEMTHAKCRTYAVNGWRLPNANYTSEEWLGISSGCNCGANEYGAYWVLMNDADDCFWGSPSRGVYVDANYLWNGCSSCSALCILLR